MKKIFIIDSDKLITATYADFFAAKGYIVGSTNTPFGIVCGIKVIAPDVVILDMNLPGLKRNGLLNFIDCHGSYRIVLTSVDSQRDEMKTLTENGQAHDYFVKGEPLHKLGYKIFHLLGSVKSASSQ